VSGRWTDARSSQLLARDGTGGDDVLNLWLGRKKDAVELPAGIDFLNVRLDYRGAAMRAVVDHIRRAVMGSRRARFLGMPQACATAR